MARKNIIDLSRGDFLPNLDHSAEAKCPVPVKIDIDRKVVMDGTLGMDHIRETMRKTLQKKSIPTKKANKQCKNGNKIYKFKSLRQDGKLQVLDPGIQANPKMIYTPGKVDSTLKLFVNEDNIKLVWKNFKTRKYIKHKPIASQLYERTAPDSMTIEQGMIKPFTRTLIISLRKRRVSTYLAYDGKVLNVSPRPGQIDKFIHEALVGRYATHGTKGRPAPMKLAKARITKIIQNKIRRHKLLMRRYAPFEISPGQLLVRAAYPFLQWLGPKPVTRVRWNRMIAVQDGYVHNEDRIEREQQAQEVTEYEEVQVGTVNKNYRQLFRHPKSLKHVVKKIYKDANKSMIRGIGKMMAEGNLDWIEFSKYMKGLMTRDHMGEVLAAGAILKMVDGIYRGYRDEDQEEIELPELVSRYLSNFSSDKIKRLLIADHGANFHDIYDAANQWHDRKEDIHINKSLKTFKELHDDISCQFRRLKDKNMPIEIPEQYQLIHDQEIDGWGFKYPEDTHTLVDWGTLMNNCIASYKDQVRRHSTHIIGIYRKGKLTYNMQIGNDGRIGQFYGKGNSRPKDGDSLMLREILMWAGIWDPNTDTYGLSTEDVRRAVEQLRATNDPGINQTATYRIILDTYSARMIGDIVCAPGRIIDATSA